MHPEFPSCEERVEAYARELLRERRHQLETLESELQLIGMTPSDCQSCRRSLLTSDEHDGNTYNLNGPEPLSGPKAASIWSKLLGKEIRYAGHDMDAFEEQMRNSAPSWSAFDIRMMFQGYLERGFVAETGDVEKLTKLLGHAPRRYEDFAAETAALWK
jgi:uncharacterized protein YbjT (DUF2867 family)